MDAQTIKFDGQKPAADRPDARVVGHLRRLRHLAELLHSSDNEKAALGTALIVVLDMVGGTAGWVMLLDSDGTPSLAASLGLPAALTEADDGVGKRCCNCLRLLSRGGLTQAVNMVECEQGDRLEQAGLGRIHATVPLRTDQGSVGVLNVLAARPFDAGDLAALTMVGHVLGGVLERGRLSRQLAACTLLNADDMTRASCELLGFVAHELQTPVAALKAAASSVLFGPAESTGERARTFLPFVAREAERLSRMIRSFLDLARSQAGVPLTLSPALYRPADLVAAAAEVVTQAADNFLVQVDLPNELPAALCDRDKVVEVLINLLSNAQHQSPPGEPVEIRVSEDAGDLCFTVIDHGRGIPAELKERLFEPFAKGPNPRHGGPGTGLGLYLSKMLVEAHGGAIWADDALEGGAAFHFTLPAAGRAGGG
jgi:K+-sensing histidine kinase KdpD